MSAALPLLGRAFGWAIGAGCSVAAPAIAIGSGAGAGASMASALIQGALATVGAWWVSSEVNDRTEERFRRKEKSLPPPEALLRNGHLHRLLDLSLAQTIEVAQGSRGFQAHRAALEKLGQASSGFFAELAEAEGAALLDSLRAGAPMTETLSTEDLQDVVARLVRRAGLEAEQGWHERLARHLEQHLLETTTGILTRDYGGGSPLEGNGFAAFWLDLERRILASLERQEQDDERRKKLDERFQKRLQGFLVRAYVRERELRAWLEEWRDGLDGDLQHLLDATREILAANRSFHKAFEEIHSTALATLDDFELGFWRRLEQPSFLGPLLQDDAARDELRRAGAAGREEELQDFLAFLEHPERVVQFWQAMPGAGKTHLAIAMARQGRSRGWLPIVLEQPVQGEDPVAQITSALKRAARREASSLDAGAQRGARILIVWDTSGQPPGPETVRSIYALPRRTALAAHAIKILVLAWPAHAGTLVEEFRQQPWFVARDLEPLVDRAGFVRLVQALLPLEQKGRAAEVVRRAEGIPLAALTAVITLRAGGRIQDLGVGGQILRARYHQLLVQLQATTAQQEEWEARLALLRQLAVLGLLRDGRGRSVFGEEWGRQEGRLGSFCQAGLLQRVEGGYRMAPDRLRLHLIWESLHPDGGFPMALDAATGARGFARLVSPWMTLRGLGEVYSMVQQALGAATNRPAVLEAMDAALAERLDGAGLDPATKANTWYVRGMLAGTEATRTACARRIEQLLGEPVEIWGLENRQQVASRLAGMYLVQSAGATEAEARMALVESVQALLDREPGLKTPTLVLMLARILVNAGAVAMSAEERIALAGRVAALVESEGEAATPELAQALARAYFNATTIAGRASQRLEQARRIAEIMERNPGFATPEIALERARALVNASAVEPKADRCAEIAREVETLLESDPAFATPEIALEVAKALLNLCLRSSQHQRRQVIGRLDALAQHDPAFATPEMFLRRGMARAFRCLGPFNDGGRLPVAREAVEMFLHACQMNPRLVTEVREHLGKLAADVEDRHSRRSFAALDQALSGERATTAREAGTGRT